jgi:hypothetical protein
LHIVQYAHPGRPRGRRDWGHEHSHNNSNTGDHAGRNLELGAQDKKGTRDRLTHCQRDEDKLGAVLIDQRSLDRRSEGKPQRNRAWSRP